jgi:hypothetical protein
MGQRGREGGLAETIAAQRLSGTSSPLGGGADAVMDRPTEEDEQRLRKALCERRSVRVRCDDSPYDEAARPSLRTFHTASEGKFYEVELPLYGVLRSSPHARNAQATAKIVTLGDTLAAIGAYTAFVTWPALRLREGAGPLPALLARSGLAAQPTTGPPATKGEALTTGRPGCSAAQEREPPSIQTLEEMITRR